MATVFAETTFFASASTRPIPANAPLTSASTFVLTGDFSTFSAPSLTRLNAASTWSTLAENKASSSVTTIFPMYVSPPDERGAKA